MYEGGRRVGRGGQVTASLIRHCGMLYRVIQKSLRDFRPLRYSNRDGHAEREHVMKRERDSEFVLPYRCSICPTLVTQPMSNLAILANSKTQKAFLFPVDAMFRHDCPLAVRSARAPSTQKKLGEILYLLICSFLLCLSWLLRSRFRKFRRDL